ncbi:MAG: hypothetical protein PHW47_01645 [Lachnospira sp.]|nr:hypothetical protein [Lachnospira sp.]
MKNEDVNVVSEETTEDKDAHLSKNYENENTVSDDLGCQLLDGVVQRTFGGGDGCENPELGKVAKSEKLQTAMSIYSDPDMKFVVELWIQSGKGAEGEETFHADNMYAEYNRLKGLGVDVTWVPAGHYTQNDGSDEYRTRNKIYAVMTPDEMDKFPASEKYGYGLYLMNYAEYSYVDGNYKELHQAYWDSHASNLQQ